MLHHFHYFYQNQSINNLSFSNAISFIANIVTIAGIALLVFAYLDYKNKQKEEKKDKLKEILRAISSVKYQLKVIGDWCNSQKGGYHEKDISDWIKKERNIRGNPFHNIFMIEYSSIKDLTVLPAIEYFNEEISESVARVNQWITSFNSTLNDIKQFSLTRDSDKNIILHLKLNKVLTVKITPEEDRFISKLVEMYAILHFQIIGDQTTETLYFWYKKLVSLLRELEKQTLENLKKLD
jgi:hypothetical protein